MKRDYATTFITEALVISSYLLVFRVVATHLGATGFGEYALSRRTLSFLLPVGVVGLDVAVARFVAYAASDKSPRERAYAPAAMLMMAATIGSLTVILLLFQNFFAQLFFGSPSYAELITPLPLLLIGGGLHGTAYGYLRGRSRIQEANVLMALNHAVVPLAAVFLGGTVPRILMVMGFGWIAVSLLYLAFMPYSLEHVDLRLFELAKFGFPRTPGDLLQLGLFALPGILIAHLVDVRTAGIVAFGVAALGMIGSALTPISFVLLPAAAGLFARGSLEEVRREVLGIARIAAPALLLGVLVVELFAQPIVTHYLGPQFAAGTQTLRLIMIGALPWGLYVILKSVIDARHVRPINARNMAAAFVTFVIAITAAQLVGVSAVTIVIAFVLSLYVLGGLTILEVARTVRGERERAPVIPVPPLVGPALAMEEMRYEKVRRYLRDLTMYMQDTGKILIALFSVGCIGLLLAVWLVWGTVAIVLGIGLLLSLTSIVAMIILGTQATNYRQIESLFSLFSLLRIEHPLPQMRGWAVSPDFATVIVSAIQDQRPRCIVEAGSGVSTLIAGYCLRKLGSGRIVSLEHDEAYAQVTNDNIRKHGLQDYARVVYAPLRRVSIGGQSWLWYDTDQLAGVPSINMVIVDGPPGNIQKLARYPAVPLLLDRLSDDAMILLDDCVRHDEKATVALWLRDFEGFVSQLVETEKGTMVIQRGAPAPGAVTPPVSRRLFELVAPGFPD